MRERFETKFIKEPDSGCWIWGGTLRGDGYGAFKCNGRMLCAHRMAYELYIGPIQDGLLVLHRCDVPLCVNPEHLFLGTQADNMRDMVQKSRQAKGDRNGSVLHPERLSRGDLHWARANPERLARGENHVCAKLTADEVIAIRSISGVTHRRIADMYGVSKGLITNIRNGRAWKHIIPPRADMDADLENRR